ncbi:MATE efflux family protein [Alkaliphilus metalliredigens QYMF]|uniref:Probable multidrug resistance protein NorM n=1 Tax=Alkaliphilus metalliredigens (strain QYMF) TaxID=293826 RepID=A6TVU2_ALKMQ|nr:MATE family efflux transporter [Alkaliphilus metalliredigens]ABR50310.1 MATE efflux family protein [Alkaliphilus metalliredigens QYMF]
MTKGLFNDKVFYKTMLAIALPITIQNLISSALNTVDTIMIGNLGELEIAAVGLANQFFFMFVLLLFGINSGASIFISQFWGRQDIKNIHRVLGIALISGGILSLVFAVGAFGVPNVILGFFTHDQSVIDLGSQYLRIVSLSYFATAVTFAYSFAARSTGEAKLPMVVSAVSLSINTVLNYIYIFGKFGAPALGVSGAAWATLAARSVEMVLLLGMVYGKKYAIAGKIKDMMNLTREFVLKYFKTAYPVILNEGFWSLGMTMYTAIYARISTEAIASVQIANTVQSIFMVVGMGLGNACAVMLGNEIGGNHKERAFNYAKKFAILGPLTGGIMGMLLFALAPYILKLFNVSTEVHINAIRILMVLGVFMAFKIFNAILVIGIVRSGGDTKFSLFLELGSVWLIGVPLAFLGAHVWQLPIYWVVVLVSMEEVVKAGIGSVRLISKKWIHNVVEQM